MKLVRDGEDDMEPILNLPTGVPKLRRIAPKPIPNENTMQTMHPKDHTYTGVQTMQTNISADRNTYGEDEFETFGKHVASQLRKLTTVTYLMAQEEIQCTLTKLRMNDINRRTSH